MTAPSLLPRAGLALALVALGACSEDKSFAVVSVLSGGAEIPAVAQLRVDVTNGPYHDILFYPEGPTAALKLNAATAVTFSVSFRTSYTGQVDIEVEALHATGRVLGYGKDTQTLRMRRVVKSTVLVIPGATRPLPAGDGGVTADGGTPRLLCQPHNPAPSCGLDKTCIVRCPNDAPAEGMCFQAGNKRPGEACSDNQDCEPGSQCFEFACSTPADPRKTCLRFCQDDASCGSGARCNTVVPCGNQSTTFRICSRPCDPAGSATTGCATGLHCFIFAGETTTCECRDATRVGTVGATCLTDENCAPGLMCVDRAGLKTCRPVCHLAAPVCASGTCTKLVNPDYQVFGACM